MNSDEDSDGVKEKQADGIASGLEKSWKAREKISECAVEECFQDMV